MQGVRAPLRFQDISEAWRSRKPFVLRSEHRDEYDGPSGLHSSVLVTQKLADKAKHTLRKCPPAQDVLELQEWNEEDSRCADWNHITLKALFLSRLGSDSQLTAQYRLWQSARPAIREYCSLTGKTIREHLAQLSFSLWEYIPGVNHAVVADSCVPNRFHVFSRVQREDAGDPPMKFTLLEDDSIIHETASEPHELPDICLRSVVRFYEHVRCLPCFDRAHCPLIEIQTHGDTHYFLQYHRTRDFREATHHIERAPEEGEVEALFVRGSTGPEPVTVQAALLYPQKHIDRTAPNLPEDDASFDRYASPMFSEVMSRRRRIQFLSGDIGMANLMRYGSLPHGVRSQLYKPEISVGLPRDSFLPEGFNQMWREATRTGTVPRVPLQVLSDGRRCYVKEA